MKLFIKIALCMLPVLPIMSCKKCYECTKETTLISKGEEIPASASEDVCGKKDKKELEGEGFTCVKTDKK